MTYGCVSNKTTSGSNFQQITLDDFEKIAESSKDDYVYQSWWYAGTKDGYDYLVQFKSDSPIAFHGSEDQIKIPHGSLRLERNFSFTANTDDWLKIKEVIAD